MTAQSRSAPRLSIGASACLTGALEFAWHRQSASAGTPHVLLALVARGDPISARALAEAGVTYRAVCGVLDGPRRWDDSDGGVAVLPDGSDAAEILADASRIGPPGRISRLLRFSPSLPRSPVPPWTRNVETMVEDAVRSARAARRRRPCRADVTVALLSQEDCAAAEVLALLGVGRERLLERLGELFGSGGPAPVSPADYDIRPSGWVLGFLLKSGSCALPGRPDSAEWRAGLTRMVLDKLDEIAAELGQPAPGAEHVLLAFLATYEELAADEEHFGPGWQRCFPAGDALARHGITYQRARQLLLELSPEADGGPVGTNTANTAMHEARKFFGLSPTTRDGVHEATRLLGHKLKPDSLAAAPEISLLGVLHEKNQLANQMLLELGIDRDELRQTLLSTLGGP